MSIQGLSAASLISRYEAPERARRAVEAQGSATPESAADRGSISAAAARLAGTSAGRPAQPASPTGSAVDYTRMSPEQMRIEAQSLYDAGQIDLTELFMLQNAGMPLGKVGPNGEFLPLSDAERAAASTTPVNYLKVFEDGLQFLKQSGYAADPKSGFAQMTHILETLKGAMHPPEGLSA